MFRSIYIYIVTALTNAITGLDNTNLDIFGLSYWLETSKQVEVVVNMLCVAVSFIVVVIIAYSIINHVCNAIENSEVES